MGSVLCVVEQLAYFTVSGGTAVSIVDLTNSFYGLNKNGGSLIFLNKYNVSVRIFEIRFDVYYFRCNFSDCYPHLYCCTLKHKCFGCCYLRRFSGVYLGLV